MYNHLPDKAEIPELMITDSQISSVVKGYYSDPDFSCRNGEIGLWNLYNLITDANKSSYIVCIRPSTSMNSQIVFYKPSVYTNPAWLF